MCKIYHEAHEEHEGLYANKIFSFYLRGLRGKNFMIQTYRP